MNPLSGMPETLHFSNFLLRDHHLAWSRSTLHPDGTWELEGSPAYTALTGFSRAYPSEQPLGLSLAGDAPPQHALRIAEALWAGTVTTFTVQAVRADGTPLRDRVTVAPVHDAPAPTWLTLHHDLDNPDTPAVSADQETPLRNQRRTAWLIEHFDALTRASTHQELCRTAVDALVPRVGVWAGLLRHPARQPNVAELVAQTPPPPESSWPDHAVEAVRTDRPSATEDAGLTTVSVTAVDSVTWTMAIAPAPSQALDQADIEMLRIQVARLGGLAAELGRDDHERHRIRTIESVILAPPGPLQGLDIAAETVLPRSPESQAAWCDAFPIPGGTAMAVSHVYNADTDTLTWSAMARPTLRAMLWRSLDPRGTLVELTSFAFDNVSKIPLSVGQLVTLIPDGENFALRMASAVYLPLVLRIPGEGFRIIGETSNDHYLAGSDSIPLARADLTVPPGTVIAMLTPTIFDGNLAFMVRGPSQLVESWRALPEDAPAAAYAQIAVNHCAKKDLTSRCVLVARIPAPGDLP